ncbi:flavin reductase domain protein FMN-binding [Acidovorax delafieldii 2AN]|uniref:Flavin reductase domain protein FMN-binding n=1 Tax=Acidovorax delafieldii 2AN TaxID=573060 RepID=C5T5F3_ACIDE|nr:flavin reductase domain protein FMN-binding [Acidovorax delafieldii 2AN]
MVLPAKGRPGKCPTAAGSQTAHHNSPRHPARTASPLVNSSPPRPAIARSPSFSAREFRDALGMFATGVTIVTARNAAGEPIGLTANSFNSVSLEPPLVLWSLSRAAASMPAFANGSHYAINVLAAGQKALAERFAARGIDRFAGVDHQPGISGAPLLAGALATFECFNRSRYEEGDHVIFVGEVERCRHHAGLPPLLYHGGRFYTEHPL